MGYMCYHAIVVTDSGYGDFIIEAHAVATALFRSEVIQRDTYSADKAAMVSPILLAPINGHRSFFIAPDGSKEGWDISKNGNTARAKFREYLRSLEYADGSTPLKWVEVQYGDDDLVTAIIDDSDATWRNINRRKDSSIESSGDEDTNLRNAEAAEARADEMEVDRDNWKARADAAEYEVMARPGIGKQFQALNEGLIAARAQLAALKAAGEWWPVTETDPPNGPWVQVGWPDGNISKAHRYDEDTWINTDGLKFKFVPGKNPMFRYLPTPPKGNLRLARRPCGCPTWPDKSIQPLIYVNLSMIDITRTGVR